MTGSTATLNYFIEHAWDWDLSEIGGCTALMIVFALWTRFKPYWRALAYMSGVAVMFLSLASPLDALSDEYLFSAHMLQHFLLLMIVPILMILGLPEAATGRLLAVPWVSRAEKRLCNPIVAWMFANLVLWAWHVPALYDWAVRDEGVHVVEHLMFLVSATVFWWPVLAPTARSRLPFGASMIYLVLAALSNMALGILLTFAKEPLYRAYLTPTDSWHILGILRSEYHLNGLADQAMGGILMWVLGGVVFLGVILVQFGRWYGEEQR